MAISCLGFHVIIKRRLSGSQFDSEFHGPFTKPKLGAVRKVCTDIKENDMAKGQQRSNKEKKKPKQDKPKKLATADSKVIQALHKKPAPGKS